MHPNTSETTRLRPLSPNTLWRRGRWMAIAFALGLVFASFAYRGALDDEARLRPVIYAEQGAEVHYNSVNVTACGVSLICGN